MIIAKGFTKVFKLTEDGVEWPGFIVLEPESFRYVDEAGAVIFEGPAREVDGETEITVGTAAIRFSRTSEGHSVALGGKTYRLVAQLPALPPIDLMRWVLGLIAQTNERARAAGLPAGQITPGDVRPFPTGGPRT